MTQKAYERTRPRGNIVAQHKAPGSAANAPGMARKELAIVRTDDTPSPDSRLSPQAKLRIDRALLALWRQEQANALACGEVWYAARYDMPIRRITAEIARDERRIAEGAA